jgi:hypothetical protein
MADAPPPTAKQAEGIGCLQDGLAKDTYLGGCTLVDSSNPTVSTGVDPVPDRHIQNPSVLATQRDSKNDSIWAARREIGRPSVSIVAWSR